MALMACIAVAGFAALLWVHVRSGIMPDEAQKVKQRRSTLPQEKPAATHRPRKRAPASPRKARVTAVTRDLESALRNLGYRSADLRARVANGEAASVTDLDQALRAALRQ
jgi:Holliday junction resolvasome RuvABC DNA-binding subunit